MKRTGIKVEGVITKATEQTDNMEISQDEEDQIITDLLVFLDQKGYCLGGAFKSIDVDKEE